MLRLRTVRMLAIACATIALLLGCATVATADPIEPVLHFDALRSALAASPSHHLDGYMKTVVEGSDIVTIPVTVLAVPPTGTAQQDLILLEATGPLIDKYGGIVAGMSGSPVYVNDGTGTDKLVGAISYGDMFTLGGTGLATPIDAMSAIENGYSSAAPLSAPVLTSTGNVINRIVIAPNPQDYAGAAAQGALVARPLASVFIGGLDPSTTGYKALAKRLAARGVATVALSRKLSGGADDGSGGFETTLTAGASIAALETRGDLWVGGIGTVTYANGANVLAFGHPALYTGNTSLYMANAWIEGVWPSALEPYKLGDPGAIRGTITQDRLNGILGKSDLRVAETTITAYAHDVSSGKTTTSTVYVPQSLIANGIADSSIVGNAVYMAGSSLYDQRSQPGSAHTTTTVTLQDGPTTRVITMVNYSSQSSDIAFTASQAAATAITTLQSVLQFGLQKPQVLSVDLTGDYSPTRTDATIVGVDAPNGLHVGSNLVRVSVLEYGVPDTQTVDASITIPAGTVLNGTILASAANLTSDNAMTSDPFGTVFSRKSISALVDQLNSSLPDTEIVLTYQPSSLLADVGDFLNPRALNPVTTQFGSPWPISGQAHASTPIVSGALLPSTIDYGGFVMGVMGEIDGPTASTVVTITAQPAGSSVETFIATGTADPFGDTLEFDVPIFRTFTTNTSFHVHVAAQDGVTGADQVFKLNVRAVVSLSPSTSSVKAGKPVTLTMKVSPNTASGGTVVFEQQVGKKWLKIGQATLKTSGSKAVATLSWKPGKGTHKVRARYLGGTYNSATTSGNIGVIAK